MFHLIFYIFDARSGLQLLSALVSPWCRGSVGIGSLMFRSWHLRGIFWCSGASKDHCASHEDQIAPSPHLCSLYPHRSHCQFHGGLFCWPCRHICHLDFDLAAFLYICFKFSSQQIHHQYGISQRELMNLVTFYLHPHCSTSQLAGLLFLAAVPLSVFDVFWGHGLLCPINHARDRILCYPIWLGGNSQQASWRGRKVAWQIHWQMMRTELSVLSEYASSLDPEASLDKGTRCQSTGNRLKTHSILFEQTHRQVPDMIAGKWAQLYRWRSWTAVSHGGNGWKWGMHHLLTFQQLSWTCFQKQVISSFNCIANCILFTVVFHITTPCVDLITHSLSRNTEQGTFKEASEFWPWVCNTLYPICHAQSQQMGMRSGPECYYDTNILKYHFVAGTCLFWPVEVLTMYLKIFTLVLQECIPGCSSSHKLRWRWDNKFVTWPLARIWATALAIVIYFFQWFAEESSCHSSQNGSKRYIVCVDNPRHNCWSDQSMHWSGS